MIKVYYYNYCYLIVTFLYALSRDSLFCLSYFTQLHYDIKSYCTISKFSSVVLCYGILAFNFLLLDIKRDLKIIVFLLSVAV